MSWIWFSQSKCKGNENPLKFSHRKVKISVSRLIFLYFVPLLFLQASKTLFYSSKKQFLDNYVTSGATMISMRELLLPLGYNLVFFTGINNKA